MPPIFPFSRTQKEDDDSQCTGHWIASRKYYQFRDSLEDRIHVPNFLLGSINLDTSREIPRPSGHGDGGVLDCQFSSVLHRRECTQGCDFFVAFNPAIALKYTLTALVDCSFIFEYKLPSLRCSRGNASYYDVIDTQCPVS